MKLGIRFGLTPYKDHRLYSNHLPMIIGFLLFTLIAVFAGDNERTPTPLGLQAPERLFSARRAYAALHAIYLHNTPHPTGSLAQQRIGDRIIDYFRNLGYTPELQEVLVAGRVTPTCGVVRNIIIRCQGVRDEPGILVASHYDSVPCGAGGMDDGAGTATILELARILRHAPRPHRTIVFLLTDGEELGLLGAKAFIEHSSEENTISTVIGIDAGGDGGRSRVTQITGNEDLLTAALSHQANVPSGSSAINSILNSFYLTEGTSDFEEFKKAEKSGINLINVTWNYRRHTPEDKIETINLGTLQDHGLQALSLIRRLSGSKQIYPKQGKRGKVVFFDLLGMVFIHYAYLWAWILQGVSFILAGLVWKRYGFDNPLKFISLFAKWLAVIAAGTVGGGLAGYIAVNLPQMPFLLKPALILGSAVFVELIAFRSLKMHGLAGMEALTAWNLIGTITCIWLTGASYLFTIPALVMGLAAITMGRKEHCRARQSYPWTLWVAALLWLPLFDILIEYGAPFYLLSIPILLIIELMLPYLKNSGICQELIIAGLSVFIILFPLYWWVKPVGPRPKDYANIVYLYETGRRQALWLLPTRLEKRMRNAVGSVIYQKVDNPLIRVGGKLPVAEAPRLNLPPPVVTIKADQLLSGGERQLTIYLQSQSQARVMRLAVRPRPVKVRVNGLLVLGLSSNRSARLGSYHREPWGRYQFIGKITKGMTLAITVPAHQKVDLIVMDQIDGLPSFGEKLRNKRPSDILQTDNGDVTLIAKKYRIGP